MNDLNRLLYDEYSFHNHYIIQHPCNKRRGVCVLSNTEEGMSSKNMD